jgi:cellulose synthase (UDP-forming)
VQVYGLPAEGLLTDTRGQIRFEPYSGGGTSDTLPVAIRNVEADGDLTIVGCRYLPEVARHHSLVADLIFANSQQWSEFQRMRRGNPGLLRGTLWFLWLAFYQMSRGFIYLFRSVKTEAGESR